MATYTNPIQPIVNEQNLTAGTHVLYTCPQNRGASINDIRVTTPLANTVTFTVTRAVPAGAYNVYVFNLSAGDSMVDTSLYILNEGDSVSLTITSSATVLLYGQVTKTGRTVF
jgi:Na+-transporting NADH:ubiquinone oxidoreductase subunit NqrF